MKSTSARQRRKAKREAKRQRIIAMLVSARLDGIDVEPLKGLPEHVLRQRIEETKRWHNTLRATKLQPVKGGWVQSATP